MNDKELFDAFERYVRGVNSELQGVTLQPVWASFLRSVEHYAMPDATEEQLDYFRRTVVAFRGHCDYPALQIVPPDLRKPLEQASQ